MQLSALLNIFFDRSKSVQRLVKERNNWEEMTRLQTCEGKQQRKNFTTDNIMEMYAEG